MFYFKQNVSGIVVLKTLSKRRSIRIGVGYCACIFVLMKIGGMGEISVGCMRCANGEGVGCRCGGALALPCLLDFHREVDELVGGNGLWFPRCLKIISGAGG